MAVVVSWVATYSHGHVWVYAHGKRLVGCASARGHVTLLTRLWKTGKTTLLGVLLRHLRRGGTLAGCEVAAGRAVVVSEDPPVLWKMRDAQLDF